MSQKSSIYCYVEYFVVQQHILCVSGKLHLCTTTKYFSCLDSIMSLRIVIQQHYIICNKLLVSAIYSLYRPIWADATSTYGVIKLKIFSTESQVQEEMRPPFSKPSMTHSEWLKPNTLLWPGFKGIAQTSHKSLAILVLYQWPE